LLSCFVEAPAAPGIGSGLEVLGDDYTGYGDEEGKLAHCKLIVALANSAGGVRDDLDVDDAEAQYEEAAKALVRAAERKYPVTSIIDVKLGNHIVKGEVMEHRQCWWSSPGQFVIRNVKTDSLRKVTHYDVKRAQGDHK
jgi:hypothetical protein